jgi:hypothetical protein
MKPVKTPSEDHAHFDEICAAVGEWEPHLAVTGQGAEHDEERSDEDRTSELDGQILAGLVSP